MADLNALIAQGAQFQAPVNPFTQYAQMQQLDQGNTANQLAQYQLSSARRADSLNERILNYMSSPDYKPEGLAQFGTPGIAALKSVTEAQNANLTGKKLQMDTQKGKQEFIQQAERDTSRNPSDANLTAYKEDIQMNTLFSDAEKKQLLAKVDMVLAMPVLDRQAFLASQGAKSADLKPTLTSQRLGGTDQVLSTPAFGGAATVVPGSVQATTPAPSTEASMMSARAAQSQADTAGKRLNIEKQRLEFQKNGGAAGLTPEENDALYGPNGSVTKGLLDPYKVNGRTAKLFAGAAIANPNLDLNKYAQDSAVMRNVQTVNKARQIEMMPEILQNIVTAGKKVNFSDSQFVGAVEKFAKGQMNDPDFVNYMTQRNDGLLTLAGVMRGNGATDMSTKMENEAYHPTLSPSALDGWMTAQMKALEPRLRNAATILRTPAAAATAPAKSTPSATVSNW